jgi:hypothetical protein
MASDINCFSFKVFLPFANTTKLGKDWRECKTLCWRYCLQNCQFRFPLCETWKCEITVYPWFVESIFTFKLYMKILVVHNNYFVFVMNHCLTLNILTCKAKITSPIFFQYHSALYCIWTFQFLSRKVL